MKNTKIIIGIILVVVIIGGFAWYFISANINAKSGNDIESMTEIQRIEYLFDVTIPSKSKINETYFTEQGGRILAVKLDMSNEYADRLTKDYEKCEFDSENETLEKVSWWKLSENEVLESYIRMGTPEDNESLSKNSKANIYTVASDNDDRIIAYMVFTD